MPKLRENYIKQEKIDGKIYNMSPSANYRHSIVNILQDDAEEEDYNADTIIMLRGFPHITMTLAEVFENVE